KADPGGVETLDDLAQVGQLVADLLGRGDEEQVEAALRRVVERAREPATTVYRRCPMVAVGLDPHPAGVVGDHGAQNLFLLRKGHVGGVVADVEGDPGGSASRDAGVVGGGWHGVLLDRFGSGRRPPYGGG